MVSEALPERSLLRRPLRPPPAFDFDNPSSWPTWLLQYEDFSFAIGRYAAPTEVQVRSMLYCMGPLARVVLASTTLGDADLKDAVAVQKAFSDHLVHSPNELYESARFHRRTQQPGESADAFYTALRTMVKRCNYSSPDIEERLVRDRFLVGLLDRKLSDQLCRNPSLMLHEALTHVRQHEDADNERKARDSADSSTLAIDAARVRTNVARVRKEKPASASPDRTTQQLCPFCGRTSHPCADCPARRASCNFCRKRGHFENVCLKKKRGSRKRTPKPSASSIELHAVAGERPNAKFVEVLVDGCPLSFKVDSGTENSIVPSTFLGVPSKIQDPKSELKGPGNNVLPVLGTYIATLSWHGKFTKQLLYVLATKTVPLLGFPAIHALGVCTFVDQVSGTPQLSGDLSLDPSLFRGLGTLPEAYTIRLQPNATPFSLSVPRRLSLPLRDVVKTELDKLEAEGVIRRVDTPTDWCAGLVVVPKVSGGYRLCVDLTRLNKVTLRERHVLPTVEQCLGLLGEATVFSKLDATSSFHQVKLSPESQEYTTFITPFGRYCFLRLPFGIASAPEYFQRHMSRIIEGQAGVVNMIDDILVFGKTCSEHDRHLRQVMDRLTKAGITLKREKCSFATSSVKFLGVVVSAQGISPDSDKVAAIQAMHAPEDVSGVRRLLGLVNHIGRFLPHVSEVTAPIRALLPKNSVWTWGHAQQSAFSQLKKMLCSDICVARYDTAYRTTVSADASSYGLGAVLLQEQPSGERRAVAFASRSLTPTERRYSQTEKEALAACWAVQSFEEYVRGLQFFLETDHQPLVALLGSMDVHLLPPRIQRFRLKLMRFQYQVLYVPGKLLATADTLSRAPLDSSPYNRVNQVELFVQEVVRSFPDIVSPQLEHLRQAHANDGVCSLLLQYCANGWPRQSHLPLHVKRYWQHQGDLSVCEGLLLKGSRIVVPSALQSGTLELLHDGHQGINRCKALARESVWWPGINNQIETLASNCPTCAETRVQRSEPMLPSATPTRPWEEVGVDLFHLNGQDCVLLVDYRSRFPELISLRSTSAPAVINVIKSVFARHGIPRLVRSDNGPQFAAREFSAFADSYGFRHVTSRGPIFRSQTGRWNGW
ncbi:uncharacterized protein K02A2.6-like [Dermacentor silvarum]|uniref:uncharacterized protein K02A2.6-like n=1 Tax=Dermacentor silvarum TaxID=543639 RepID=UPI001899F93B|nr:uncharacterized protein K02A2.6-like [Dermacentor silvarum]